MRLGDLSEKDETQIFDMLADISQTQETLRGGSVQVASKPTNGWDSDRDPLMKYLDSLVEKTGEMNPNKFFDLLDQSIYRRVPNPREVVDGQTRPEKQSQGNVEM